jgi:hypothetical protein
MPSAWVAESNHSIVAGSKGASEPSNIHRLAPLSLLLLSFLSLHLLFITMSRPVKRQRTESDELHSPGREQGTIPPQPTNWISGDFTLISSDNYIFKVESYYLLAAS